MMGLIGTGNNPMVGATVAVAVAVEPSEVISLSKAFGRLQSSDF